LGGIDQGPAAWIVERRGLAVVLKLIPGCAAGIAVPAPDVVKTVVQERPTMHSQNHPVVAVLIVYLTPAFAQLPPHSRHAVSALAHAGRARGGSRQRRPDVQKYCENRSPDTMRVLSAFSANRSRISAECNRVLSATSVIPGGYGAAVRHVGRHRAPSDLSLSGVLRRTAYSLSSGVG